MMEEPAGDARFDILLWLHGEREKCERALMMPWATPYQRVYLSERVRIINVLAAKIEEVMT